jgi:outer membrane protein OmpA-like peptidoglycan-associated protein
MYRKLALGFVCVLLVCGAVSAAEMGLTSVLYPEGKQVNVPIAGTQRALAAELKAKVRHRSGQSEIEIQYKGLEPAVLFGGDIVSYVVWAVSPNGSVDNLGGIANDGKLEGTANFSTGKRDFGMMITAEPITSVRGPGDLVVFFSGTPSAKGVELTGFMFGGLSTREGLIMRERESIAGMTYKADKKKSLALIQAMKAVELLDRFEAAKYDRATYDKAVAAAAEAQAAKVGKQLEPSERALVFSGQALQKTVKMIEAEEAAAKEAEAAAERQAFAGTTAELKAELDLTAATLVQTESKLETAEAELAAARVVVKRLERASGRLARQARTLADQLAGGLGQMASGVKTDRGFVVSLSGTAFPSGKSTLTTDAKYVLAKLSGMLLVQPDTRLSIEGHTDSTGGAELNRKLSLARAEAVKTFLTEVGVSGNRVAAARGFGPDRPVAPNDTEEGRAKNRRVEIVLIEN